LLGEEISAVKNVVAQQREVLMQYMRIGDPSSFRITTQSRRHQYKLETALAEKCPHQLNELEQDLGELNKHLTTLEQKVLHRIEVLAEDNGKLILVFTLLTAIFLPLFFVTSYFGMNTADIRDMTKSQSMF
jgi:Mg2+ and Co2+ transporter CorA